jgi:hypothetical protein
VNAFKLKRILIYLLLLSFSGIAEAQQNATTGADSLVIYRAITPASLRDSVAIDPQLCKTLAIDYLRGLNNMRPDEYQHVQQVANLVKFYSTDAGVKKVLADWVSQTGGKNKNAPGIERIIARMIRIDSRDSLSRGYDGDVENKYATILILCKDERKDYDIYLNAALVCPMSEAKNGIRVQSQKDYIVELRYDNATACQWKIKLKERERKTIQCAGQ